MNSTELAREQAHVDHAYARLEVLRARARALGARVLDRHSATTHQARYERDVTVHASLRRLAELEVGSLPLVFGRIDRTDGERFHIGRVAVYDEAHAPLVVDWRAPVAEPFYRATPHEPLGLLRRRHFRTRGRRLLGMDDERFGPAEAARELPLVGEAALLEAIARSRTGRMTDIVATIQAEQDAVIRAPLAGTLVVQGGPGTGKTAVALHRAAYLLYTHRARLESAGVLLVGPTPVFLRYIEEVLPALGEQQVRLATVAGLVPGCTGTAVDPPRVARLKGDARMAAVLARAAAGKKGADPRLLLWGLLSSPARIEKAAQGILSADEQAGLCRVGERAGSDWTEADAPLIDELATLLGPPPGRRRQPRLDERQLQELERFVEELAAVQPMDDRMRRDLLDRVVAARTEELADPGGDAEDAAYGHVLVDEAQDLSPMAWRMLGRRCPSGSMTIVGDLGQATGPWAPRSWEEVTAHLPARREGVRGDAPDKRVTMTELTINYRTPAEIMAFADQVRPPWLRPARAVRQGGAAPTVRRVRRDQLRASVTAAVGESLAAVGGTVGVVAPAALVSTLRVEDHRAAVSSVPEVKGLEFDAVVVVEPAAIVREHGPRALYVALTRATQRLAVLTTQALPSALGGDA
ncbi:MAG: HelD family protein [Egibacteraceae bacterium]